MRHNILVVIVGVIILAASVFADRQLQRDEILSIFQQLTSQPQKTWINAGTIEATHFEFEAPKTLDESVIGSKIKDKIKDLQQGHTPIIDETMKKQELDAAPFNVKYELANESTMSMNEVMKFDGNRYYYGLTITSRTDSIKPDNDLKGNEELRFFPLEENRVRIYVWDGDKYTSYSPTVNHALIETSGGPKAAGGPLTAGLTYWGYGYCALDQLTSAQSSAVEKYVNGALVIEVTIANLNGSIMTYVLDPQKNYAVLSSGFKNLGNVYFTNSYSNFVLVGTKWIPTTINLEQYELGTNRLLKSDQWTFTKLDANVPADSCFILNLEDNTTIEHMTPYDVSTQISFKKKNTDTDMLLAERLAYLTTKSQHSQNCATLAVKHTMSKFNKTVSDSQLSVLVSSVDGATSLKEMKQFLENNGLYCRAVKTDVEGLKSLGNCRAILHLKSTNHFVMLDSIDAKGVWVVDLSTNKYFYNIDINYLDMDWTTGVALLVSNQPISGSFADIAIAEQQSLRGAAGYTCTRLLQDQDAILCVQVGGICGGLYKFYYLRFGCESASSGSCSVRTLVKSFSEPCINDPYDPYSCLTTTPTTYSYLKACM